MHRAAAAVDRLRVLLYASMYLLYMDHLNAKSQQKANNKTYIPIVRVRLCAMRQQKLGRYFMLMLQFGNPR